MGGNRFLALGLAAVAALAAEARPADAQCRLCGTPTTTRDEGAAGGDIKLEIESSVNFDRLVLFGQGQGAAVIRPDGSSAATGSVADMGPRAMVGTAIVHGEAGRAVRIELPRQIQLYSLGSGRITFDQVVSDLPELPRLDSTGTLTFRFGGRIVVSGDAEGEYRGDLPITAEYQ
jgi:hypothetical protein